jgi:hypothetical protein
VVGRLMVVFTVVVVKDTGRGVVGGANIATTGEFRQLCLSLGQSSDTGPVLATSQCHKAGCTPRPLLRRYCRTPRLKRDS